MRDTPNPNRWYSLLGFQFSRKQVIRAAQLLAIGVIVFVVVFSVWYLPPRATSFRVWRAGGYVQYSHEQSPNVALLRMAKDRFRMLGLSPADNLVTTVELDQSNVTDKWLHNLQPLEHLSSLHLHERQLGPGLVDLKGSHELSTVRIWRLCSGDLRHLQLLPKLRHLNLFQTSCENIDFSPLASLPILDYLELPRSTVSAAQLKQISQLKSLHSLGLMAANLDANSMKGIVHLADLPKLQILYIREVTSEAIESIARIESLEYLVIERADLSDESVAVLANLPRLRQLRLERNARPLDIAALQKAMPKCRIDYTGPAGR